VGPDVHGLARINEVESHFLGILGLSSFLGRLRRWDLLSFFEHLLGFGKEGLHACREVKGLSKGEALLVAIIGDSEVGLQRKDSRR